MRESEFRAQGDMLTRSNTTLLTKLIDRTSTTSNTALVQLPRVKGALAATKRALGCRGHGITSVDLPLDDMRVVLLAGVSDNGAGQTSRRNGKNL
jgi:hypothetical protein